MALLTKSTNEPQVAQKSKAQETTKPEYKIERLDDLLGAFSQGCLPNLENKSQREAFEIYRKMRFGNPNTDLSGNSIHTVADELKKYPELKKEPLKNFKLQMQEKSYPVTDNLKALMETPVKEANQVRGNLFQVEANLGYWKKILQWQDEALSAEIKKEDKKKFQEEQKKKFITYLNEFLSQEQRVFVLDTKEPAFERGKVIYEALMKAKTKLIEGKKDITPLNRAVTDLVHSIGFHDAHITAGFKNKDGLERLSHFQRALSERDSFAMFLGYENHFEEVLSKFKVKNPSGIDSTLDFEQRIKNVEKELLEKAVFKTNSQTSKLIRHLSLIEAPFKSCIGGSDCSSRAYFTKALDPNYHYFTLTDDLGYSSGLVTVVFGNAGKTKVAFIDKIQNVPNVDIPYMLEGIRQSVLEKGYILGFSENVGDNNGLSNELSTRDYAKKNIDTEGEVLLGFKPHSNKYSFSDMYSRADSELPLKAVKPLVAANVKILPGEENKPWQVVDFDLNQLLEASWKLKHGSDEEKIRYIPSMQAIKVAGLKQDPEFDKVLNQWLTTPDTSFKLKKQVLLHEWIENEKPLESLLEHFDIENQVTLIQNFLDTPRYKEKLVKNKKDLPYLITKVRNNQKISENLIAEYAPKYNDSIQEILKAKGINDKVALDLIAKLPKAFRSQDLKEIVEFKDLIRGTVLETSLSIKINEAYVDNIVTDMRLGHQIAQNILSKDKGIREFCIELINESENPNFKFHNFPILKVYKEILDKARGDERHLEVATNEWLADERVSTELKAEFLLGHFQNEKQYAKLESEIPKEQKRKVSELLNERTNFRTFQKLASSDRKVQELLRKATPESFLYNKQEFAKEGKKVTLGSPDNEPGRSGNEKQREIILTKSFEMQITPVTQLQWLAAMGKNPSSFIENGIEVNGIKVNPNRPVENVSWNDAQEYLKKLNAQNDGYEYRLPTEAEWEYMARGDTKTAYSHGDDRAVLGEYAWFDGNSGNKTHDVAELKPNPFGVYDMYGNVWEWCQDWYASDISKLSLTDPVNNEGGSDRVLRGGSCDFDARGLRSSQRGYDTPDGRSYNVGLRVVRTKK